MEKYIDAEKLLVVLERQNVDKKVIEPLISIIESLQQEQLNNNVKEKAISLQIQAYLNTASDELYSPGKPLYTEEHYEGIHECMLMWQKLHQYYFSTMREQPNMDLEKEYKEYVEDDPVFSKLVNRYAGIIIAKHFYELGQLEMWHRITNPGYNTKIVEQLKSEYPARKEDSYEIH